MPTKIGLLSDVHATAGPVREALWVFAREGADSVLCPGDIAGYGNELEETVALLMESGCRAILGNHDLWYLDDAAGSMKNPTDVFFRSLPSKLDLEIEGKRLYMVHASPPQSYMDGIKLLDLNGDLISDQREHWTQRLNGFDYDVLVVGHTHQVFAEQLGATLVINPGSTRFNHTCAVLTLPDMQFQLFSLSNMAPQKVWNWGMNQVDMKK